MQSLEFNSDSKQSPWQFSSSLPATHQRCRRLFCVKNESETVGKFPFISVHREFLHVSSRTPPPSRPCSYWHQAPKQNSSHASAFSTVKLSILWR